ncbi:MAG: adenylate/guanylate cyclase domain-containing protein [Chloroflexi bacterium]|nr:MAG: adenylate/guanylate cyclase domain-containing protein [Chloroflexota bacterium]
MVRERVGDWRSAWRSALAGLAAGLLVLGVLQAGILDGPFFAAQDRLFPAPRPDPSITLVAIDQTSITNLGWPLISNAYHAQVIDYLSSLHPKVILFDVSLHTFTPRDPEPPFPDTNAPLIQALKAAGNVVLVCTADESPWPDFATAAAAVGDRGLGIPDPGNAVRGVVLRPPKTCLNNESDEPAFLQALRISEHIPDALTSQGNEAQFGGHHIPLVDGQMLINYSKGSGPTCTYDNIFKGGCPHPETITGHIVVVGPKLIDAGDVYSQPVAFHHDASFCPDSRPECMLDNQNYGYRIMADAMATVLQDRYVRLQPRTSIIAASLLLALIVGLAVYALSFRSAIIATATVLALYYLIALELSQQGYLADPLYTPMAVVLSAAFSLGARYVLVERERRKVERIFGQYVDPRISRQLADARSIKDVTSKGDRRELSLLFVDIRGFTAMSESMAAEDVLKVIQEYLNEMSSLILKWDGTIDKYVGDEIVALWNAPTDQPKHALWAVRCAYDLIDRAPALQAHLAAKGLPAISWGIGVNTGPAVVGNMGSKDRLQYTALGDTVNTAARFCSVAPAFTLLIGEATLDACRDYIAVDQVPGLQLKGKSADKFRIYQVVSIREDESSLWVPFPTESANESYDAIRRHVGKAYVFAGQTPGDTA